MSSGCPFCGNNPTSHSLTWYFESSNVLYTPLRQVLFYNKISNFLKQSFFKVHASRYIVKTLLGLKILSIQKEINKCAVRRAQVLWEEAIKRDINFFELQVFGKSFDTYIASKNGRSLIFSGLPRPVNYNNLALDTMDDKIIFKRKLAAAGLPVPRGGEATTLSKALKIFDLIKKPIIVKPRAGSRGRHTSTFVFTREELKQAYKIAKQLCHWVIVEEQLKGPVYRATLINFELVGVLRGDPPQVVGDGQHTLDELIKIKNLNPHPGVKNIEADIKTEIFLSRQKLNLSGVPKAGQVVELSETIGVNYGGSSSEDFSICHPDNKALFVQAAKVAGDPVVGFDFIIPDVALSFKEQECGFIEANSLPFINLHHDPLKGEPQNVAQKVWE